MATQKKPVVESVSAEQATPAPWPAPGLAQEPEGGWPPDEYSGKAGRYVRDPVTGIRRPADEDPIDAPA